MNTEIKWVNVPPKQYGTYLVLLATGQTMDLFYNGDSWEDIDEPQEFIIAHKKNPSYVNTDLINKRIYSVAREERIFCDTKLANTVKMVLKDHITRERIVAYLQHFSNTNVVDTWKSMQVIPTESSWYLLKTKNNQHEVVFYDLDEHEWVKNPQGFFIEEFKEWMIIPD